ncbi:unnamed protein product [Eruca vesicaria subsp. sativa]|uniref:Uncharacterized protein n=1 Tax=Eruca vesicaria subsp. sativa TaxID=29727 RepID=A0ABC8K3Q6_ERUVS|nr:unnamed protein product [Eruca vesicaria subsp. sativa]
MVFSSIVLHWIEKPNEILDKVGGVGSSELAPATSTEIQVVDEVNTGVRVDMVGSGSQNKKIASVIVSPPLRTATMESNVTIRSKSVTRSLSFANDESVCEEEQVIGALAEMEKSETTAAMGMVI